MQAMLTGASVRRMAKPKRETKRNDVSVKLDAEIVAEAKMVAASLDITLAEYLSEMIRPLVRADLERETARRGLTRPKGSKPESRN